MAEWQTVMKQAEFDAWVEFYRLFPFDDLHRYHRPAALIAAAANGDGEVQKRLDWLAPDHGTMGMTDADVATMRAFGFARKGT